MAVLSSASLNEKLEALNSIRQSKPEERWRIEAYRRLQDLTDITFNISGSSVDIVYVNSFENLPEPVGNRIKLQSNKIYEFTDVVDIGNHYLETSLNNVIYGVSANISGLTSNYAGPLISGSEELSIIGMELYNSNPSGQILKMDGADSSSPRRSLTFNDVTWFMSNLGTVANYNNVLYMSNAFINVQSGMEYTGNFDAHVYDTCIVTSASSGSLVFDYDLNTTIRNRVRSVFSSFTATTGSIIYNFDDSTTIDDERVQFIGCFFTSSGGSFVSGAAPGSERSLYQNNIGIRDTSPRSWYYMLNNATETVIAVTNTWVKVAGTTTSEQSEKFANTNNRATYISKQRRFFQVGVHLSAFGGNGDDLEFALAKNGTVISPTIASIVGEGAGNNISVGVDALVGLSENDYIELYARNTTDTTNLTVTSLNLIAVEIS